MKVEGLITIRSTFGHGTTLARFEAAIRANGMSVVARVDHANGGLEISVSLGATTLLMFGNRPRQAALVKALRLIALELPFKGADLAGRDWRNMAFVYRFSMACDALWSPARRYVSVHRHGRDDRRHRKKGSVAALAA